MKYFISVLLFCVLPLTAQTVKVVKIIDANLFELEDGRIVKLAGIDVPQLSHPSAFFQSVARDAVEYSKINLLNRNVTVDFISKMNCNNFNLVMMYKNYLFSKENVNSKFLLYGYGKLFNTDSSIIANDFLEMQNSAIDSKRGLWAGTSFNSKDTLDSDYSEKFSNIDLRLKEFTPQDVKELRPLYFQMPIEIISGTGVTIISWFGSTMILNLFDNEPHEGVKNGAVIGGLSIGIILGFPTGVYLSAKSQNPSLNWLYTVLTNAGFTAGALVIKTIIGNNGWILVALAPVIGSLLYTHSFAPQVEHVQNNQTNSGFHSFKDYYYSRQLFNIDLLKINF